MAKTEAQKLSLGRNIEGTLEGDKLTIVVNLKERLGASKSGNTILVATSSGNVAIPGTDVKVGINAYVPNSAK